jgi:hypothetical protein
VRDNRSGGWSLFVQTKTEDHKGRSEKAQKPVFGYTTLNVFFFSVTLLSASFGYLQDIAILSSSARAPVLLFSLTKIKILRQKTGVKKIRV